MSKKYQVLRLMQRRWVTPILALETCRLFSLSQRCGELKREGFKIESRRVRGAAYHEYRCVG